MPYKIEELLDHTAKWIRMVYEKVERHRIEDLRRQLAMRGIDPDKVLGIMDEAEDESKKRIIVAEKTLSAIGMGRTIIKPKGK